MTNGKLLAEQALEILRAEPWYVAAFSNLSALLMSSLPDLNWAGFYFCRDGQLVVGPFQGKPACIHIPAGKGVCGTCVEKDEMQVVPDVHRFPGHIACDSASRSEIVLPLHEGGQVKAVLDIDSPLPDRFGKEAAALAELAKTIEENVRWH